MRYASDEVVQRAVVRYLRGDPEADILTEYAERGIRTPPTLAVWATVPGVMERVCNETGWDEGEYFERLRAIRNLNEAAS